MSMIDGLLLWIAGVIVAAAIWIVLILQRMKRNAMLDVLAMMRAFEASIEARESSKK